MLLNNYIILYKYGVVGWLQGLRPIVSQGKPMGGMSSVDVFLRNPSPYLCEFRRKTTENSEQLGQQARPGIEPVTFRQSVLRVEPLSQWWVPDVFLRQWEEIFGSFSSKLKILFECTKSTVILNQIILIIKFINVHSHLTFEMQIFNIGDTIIDRV